MNSGPMDDTALQMWAWHGVTYYGVKPEAKLHVKHFHPSLPPPWVKYCIDQNGNDPRL